MEFIKNNKLFCLYSFLVILVFLVAILAGYIAPNDPYEASMKQALQPPSSDYLLGTDKLGRCLFSRIIYGLRISVTTSLLLVLCVFVIGTVLGVISGYFGGKIDIVIMRISDVMISFPGIVLAIAVAGMLGSSMYYTAIAIGLISWPKYTKLSRSLVHKIIKNDYISSAIVTGTKTRYVMLNYIMPNIVSIMIITAVMDIGVMMIEISALSFLGFGATPPTPELGLMLNEGRQFMQTAPWLITYSGIAIIIVVIIFNLFSDGLRDFLDPKK